MQLIGPGSHRLVSRLLAQDWCWDVLHEGPAPGSCPILLLLLRCCCKLRGRARRAGLAGRLEELHHHRRHRLPVALQGRAAAGTGARGQILNSWSSNARSWSQA